VTRAPLGRLWAAGRSGVAAVLDPSCERRDHRDRRHPRGLASIVFAVIVIEESNLAHETLIVQAIYLTVGLSVLAHGLTAAPLAGRYARWCEEHPRETLPPMESAPAAVTRPRGPPDAGRVPERTQASEAG
jgi:hypothetical protein